VRQVRPGADLSVTTAEGFCLHDKAVPLGEPARGLLGGLLDLLQHTLQLGRVLFDGVRHLPMVTKLLFGSQVSTGPGLVVPITIDGTTPSDRIRADIAAEGKPVLLGFSRGKDSLASWLAMREAGIAVVPYTCT
jgi:hypothetical protein